MAEEAAEVTYAAIRVLILVSLVALFFAMEEVHHHTDIGIVSLVFYGLLTAVCLALAWWRIFRTWMPYAFVTLDIVLVGVHLIEMTRDFGMPPTVLFGIPASGLLLLVLVHAALRFRPALIIYAGAVTIGLIMSTNWVYPTAANSTPASLPGIHGPDLNALTYWLGLPVGVLLAATAVLWLISRTMASLLESAIAQARHAVRLSRYFSPNLVDRLSSDHRALDLAGRNCTAAVLFVDIRGFTPMSEKMQPEHVCAVLTEFRAIVAEQVFAHDGTIDKFIGDAVMAVFGTPVSLHDDARRAVRCGLSILQAVHEWSQRRRWPGGVPVRIGIGGHYGEVFAGAIGNEQLLEFTVLGDTVNVAERLERLCGEVGGRFVISETLFKNSQGAVDIGAWQLLRNVRLIGRKQEISVYILPDADAPNREAPTSLGGAE